MTPDPTTTASPTLTFIDGLTDDEWATEIAHTPHLAAQDVIWCGLDFAADSGADLPGGGVAND